MPRYALLLPLTMSKAATPFNFEAALAELNKLVEVMEQGGVSLEASLANFEKGIVLIRHCQEALTKAEQKVQILTEKQDKVHLADYQHDDT